MGQRPSVDHGSSHHLCWHSSILGCSRASYYFFYPLSVSQTYYLPLPRRNKVHLIIFASLVPHIFTLILHVFKHLIQLLLSAGHLLYPLLSSISSRSSCRKLCLCLLPVRQSKHWDHFSVISECFSTSENCVTLNCTHSHICRRQVHSEFSAVFTLWGETALWVMSMDFYRINTHVILM